MMAIILVLIIMFVIPVIWLIGMIKPTLLKPILQSKTNRKWITVFCILAVIVSFVALCVVAAFDPNLSKKAENQKTNVGLGNTPTMKPAEQPQTKPQATAVNYTIVATEDLSHRALGGNNLSDYSTGELTQLPMDKKMSYKVVVAPTIKTEQVKSTVDAIIQNITGKDKNIDEIILNIYSDNDSISGMYDVANAIWAPQGELGHVNADIASSNDRDAYKTTITIKENLEEYLAQKSKSEDKFGLSEAQRRQFFKDIVAAEARARKEADNRYSSDTLAGMAKNQNEYYRLADIYRGQVMKKYGVNKDQEAAIVGEAFKENWPMD